MKRPGASGCSFQALLEPLLEFEPLSAARPCGSITHVRRPIRASDSNAFQKYPLAGREYFYGKFEAMMELPKEIGTRVGLLGGTFDPVHNGHLAAAEAAKKAFLLDSVLFIPADEPPHKLEKSISSFQDRTAMLEQALSGRPGFIVSRIEAERHGPSYTIDTLTLVRQQLRTDTVLFFIIGCDAFAEIATWKKYDRLPDYANFVVIRRLAPHNDRFGESIRKDFSGYVFDERESCWGRSGHAGRIYPLAMEPVAISSTRIRRMIASGQPVRGLVPEGVGRYIEEHGLYRTR